MRQEQLPPAHLGLKIHLPIKRLQQGQHHSPYQKTRLAGPSQDRHLTWLNQFPQRYLPGLYWKRVKSQKAAQNHPWRMFFCYSQTHIMEGKLVCMNCKREYPIINGIPNMILNENEIWFVETKINDYFLTSFLFIFNSFVWFTIHFLKLSFHLL